MSKYTIYINDDGKVAVTNAETRTGIERSIDLEASGYKEIGTLSAAVGLAKVKELLHAE